MPGRESGASEVRTISDAQALGSLANPARARLMDLLALDGPATLSTLAERAGLAVGSAAHHLNALARVGLVRSAPELARDRRETWWRLVSGALRWSRGDLDADPSATTAALAAESAKLTKHFAKARDWLDSQSDPEEPAWVGAAFTAEYWLNLTPTELSQLTEELDGVLRRWRQRPAAGDDGELRESVLVFAHGFPARP